MTAEREAALPLTPEDIDERRAFHAKSCFYCVTDGYPPCFEARWIATLDAARPAPMDESGDEAAFISAVEQRAYAAGLAARPAPEPRIKAIGPHRYSPDFQAMGDCRVCGHLREDHDASGWMKPTDLAPSPAREPLDRMRLAVAINDAQVMGTEWWGRDLLPVAEKIARLYEKED